MSVKVLHGIQTFEMYTKPKSCPAAASYTALHLLCCKHSGRQLLLSKVQTFWLTQQTMFYMSCTSCSCACHAAYPIAACILHGILRVSSGNYARSLAGSARMVDLSKAPYAEAAILQLLLSSRKVCKSAVIGQQQHMVA